MLLHTLFSLNYNFLPPNKTQIRITSNLSELQQSLNWENLKCLRSYMTGNLFNWHYRSFYTNKISWNWVNLLWVNASLNQFLKKSQNDSVPQKDIYRITFLSIIYLKSVWQRTLMSSNLAFIWSYLFRWSFLIQESPLKIVVFVCIRKTLQNQFLCLCVPVLLL